MPPVKCHPSNSIRRCILTGNAATEAELPKSQLDTRSQIRAGRMAALTLRRCATIPLSEGGAELFRERHCYTLAAGSAEGSAKPSGSLNNQAA